MQRVRVSDDEPAQRRAGAAGVVASRRAGRWELRNVAIGGEHVVLIDIANADDDVRAARVQSERGVVLLRDAVAVLGVPAILRRSDQPVLFVACDDVDHTGDGVGTIDGRSALLQHFDTIDHARRDSVQIDRSGHARARGAIHPAQAVHENQSARRAEITQIDFSCAGADAAAIWRVAEIARGVEPRVEAAAGNRRALENVGGGRKAGPGDLVLTDVDDRLVLRKRRSNPRSGHDDRVVILDGVLRE